MKRILILLLLLSLLLPLVSCGKNPIETEPDLTTWMETTAAETVGETEDADAERTEAETDIFLYRQETDGTCTVIGLRESATDTCIVIPERTPTGEKVTAIAENAFRADRRVTLVQIPATVKTIGKTAFADCPNLAYISVSFGNICYRDIDGVLYSFDGSALLCYPPARIADTVVIGSDVTAIAEMAFYQCKNLLYVQYSGSVDTWSKIEIGGLNNSLTSASITCNSTRK